MDARSIIIDLMANGYSRGQIAKQAKLTSAAVSHILNGKVRTVHRQTLFGLLTAHAAAIRTAQKRLEKVQMLKAFAEAELCALQLAVSCREVTEEAA